ncbi:MAG: PAS domain-containing protein [Pseudomonadota bacterium]
MRKRAQDRRQSSLSSPGTVHGLLKLYNLALAIRGSDDPYPLCQSFISEIVRNLKLSYGAVWLRDDAEPAGLARFASYPRARDGANRVPADHRMAQLTEQGEPVRLIDSDPDYAHIMLEQHAGAGVQVLFKLQQIGLLKLYCIDPEVLSDDEVHRLRRVVDRFGDALNGSFAARRLREEISQRELTEDKLSQARLFSQAVLDASPDIIFHKDTSGRIIGGNRAFREFWQIETPPGGVPHSKLLTPDVAAITASQDQEVIESGEAQQFELQTPTPSGKLATMEVTRAPVFDHEGRITGVLGVSRDVTQRMETLSKLQTRNRALESIGDGVVILLAGGDMPVLYVNDAFVRICERPADQLIGINARDVNLLETDLETRLKVREAVTSNRSYSFFGEGRRRSGGTIACEVTMDPVLDDQGEATHYVGIVKDVTEKTRLARELQQRQKMDAVGRLTSGIAHDFNNMLATILGFSELAEYRAQETEDPQQQEFLESIRGAAENGRELVSQLLTFSRSAPSEANAVINADESIQASLKLVRPLLPERMTLDYACENSDTLLGIDAVSLERLLMNLCLNARDAMGTSGSIMLSLAEADLTGRVCDISLARLSGEYLTLSVSDTGGGIADHIRSRIFEPFFTTKRPTQGTGMGLSVVQGIVQAHRGNVLIETNPDMGTTITAVFPKIDPETERPVAIDVAAAPGNASLSGKRILVVDDDRQVAAFLRELFVQAGMNVELAYDGSMGFKLFSDRPTDFDVLITDQTMPGMSGIELIQEVRSLRQETPCVMLTAFSQFADEASAAAVGIDRLLRKPTDNKTLLRTVAELI